MTQILVVDDHALVRDGIKRMFETQPDAVTFGEASTLHAAIALVREQAWDLVVLDYVSGRICRYRESVPSFPAPGDYSGAAPVGRHVDDGPRLNRTLNFCLFSLTRAAYGSDICVRIRGGFSAGRRPGEYR
jgi:DNA-binding NarL/FixJ family response regulator